MNDAQDRVLLEIIRVQLQGVVEEMGELLMRSGHTVFVKETQDFVVGVVTPSGEMAACSRRVGIWIGIGEDFEPVLRAGGPYEPGDVWFTNDPEESQGLVTHLPDTFCWRPIFHGGRLMCFAVAFIHCTDVGGLAPGSVAPSAKEEVQEGIAFPVTRLVEDDRIREEVMRVFLRNSRIPDKNNGDLLALLGALKRAEQRITGLIEKFGADEFGWALEAVLDYAEQQARSIIRDMPDGDYEFWDYLEGDVLPGGRPIRIRVTLSVRADELTLDFSGTDPQVPAALNIPSHDRKGHYLLVLGLIIYMRTVKPELVYNSGLVRPVHTTVPRGSLLNPEPGAACGARQATFFRVADVVLGALAKAQPDLMPAAGCGQGAIMLVSTPSPDGKEQLVSIVQPLVGGSGARPRADGTDGVDFVTGFYRNVPSEVLESELPVVVERYGLRPDSGGAGRTRGGMGLHYALRLLMPGSVVTARGLERFSFQPWGRHGGHPGAAGCCWLEHSDGVTRPLGKIDVLEIPRGATIHFETAGGGGYGPSLQRPIKDVLRDVAEGAVSQSEAQSAYGLVLSNGDVDVAATERRRNEISRTAEASEFSFGERRTSYERRWPDQIQLAFTSAMAAVPPLFRDYVRTRLIEEFTAPDGGVPDDLKRRLQRRIAVELDQLAGRPTAPRTD
jgi:N-methylhydantoinase B